MKSVLVIDDDRYFRAVLSQCLQQDGWEVIEADDGEQGLRLAVEHRPQVVLCDLLMPRCNGFQVCREIRRQNRQLPDTRIVVTTGSNYATDRLNALEAGADEYLIKPIHPPDLLVILRQLTGAGAPPPPAPPHTPAATDRTARLKFWGVRGSIPTPGPATVFYGGNTACVEVRVDGEIIILDAGTGIRSLGLALVEEFQDRPINLTLLISHTHWDHIQGFPFFEPAYNPKNRLRILGYEGARQNLEAILTSQMESPYFPIGLRQMPGYISIQELRDLNFQVGHVPAQAAFMNHPGICLGYRLNTGRGDVVYMPDNETFQRLHTQGGAALPPNPRESAEFARAQDQRLVEFIHGAHVLIVDAQYDSAEYQAHTGWGHSCVDDVVDLAVQGSVRQLFLFHHDPGHDDDRISRMVAHARELVTNRRANLKVEAAREGLEVVLQPVAKAG
jgi:phosphoribosyl 1,2-cyclic phosphodiesterase/CheY-like chemotaxis protein